MRSAAEKRKMLELFDAFVYVKDFISLIIFEESHSYSIVPQYF